MNGLMMVFATVVLVAYIAAIAAMISVIWCTFGHKLEKSNNKETV